MAKFKETDRFYALKMLSKVEVVRLRQIQHIISEKNILARINMPFIVNLYVDFPLLISSAHLTLSSLPQSRLCTFQDVRNVYLLEEYVIGGEMFSHLRRAGRFSNEMTKFYASEITLALAYLHAKDIIYRDLKPENLVCLFDG